MSVFMQTRKPLLGRIPFPSADQSAEAARTLHGRHPASGTSPVDSGRPASAPSVSSSPPADFSRISFHPSSVPVLQPKLTVNAPGDRYEQEADRVADRVMRTPEPALQRSCACGGGAHAEESDDERNRVQRKTAAPEGAGQAEAPASVRETLRSSGRPLDPATRAFMEPRFGADFSGVRVHTGDRAAQSAREVNALAYTVGRDLVFAPGRYSPGTESGRRLLAHELTHVVQQRGGGTALQRKVDPLAKAAAELEAEILADPVYKGLAADSQTRVKEIIKIAATKPLGDAKGQRNYYLKKLKVAVTTPFDGVETGKAEYGCSDAAEKKNKKAVEDALAIEKEWWEGMGFENVEENILDKAANKVERVGQGGKKFYVDRSDPRNIRVRMKVKLNGKEEEVKSIKKLEDAIERKSHTEGYTLDIVFVDTSGPDVFEFSVVFCQWANSGNWASGPTTLSHEVHHALGLPDRYDYIESHAHNRQMNVPMRLVWFLEQMKKSGGPRDPHSKMHTSGKPLLSEDICAVAFETEADRKKCIDARKDLDPAGIPPH